MKNQKPYMFLGRKGKLYAKVKIHDLDSGEERIVMHRDECKYDVERSAYDECVSRHQVICMGMTIAEPVS